MKLGNNLRETQNALIELLGFDYDTLKCTSVFEQGASDSFSKLTPKESKTVIMKILQLNKFEDYAKKCKEIAGKIETDLLGIDTNIDVIERQKKVETKDVNINIHIKQLEDISNQLKDMENKRQELMKLRDVAVKIDNLNRSYEKFGKLEKCPTCLQDIESKHKKKICSKFKDNINTLMKMLKDRDIEKEMRVLREKQEDLLFQKGSLETTIKQIKQQEKELMETKEKSDELKNAKKSLEKEVVIYTKLNMAFGRNGIPSYIIENTIPEIEIIVNDLLEMLEIDMQVNLDTQKNLKSGEIADTLDINIVTNGVTRPYYNYSGGEKFLIDLALRTALSVILLRRKGCNNSTLIIDEGFGSLDIENSDKVIRLIEIIKNKFGFKKILIITHSMDIQNNLGKRILIEKKNGISRINDL